jgi:ribosomal protein S13
VTCAATCSRTSSARSRSGASRASGTARACPVRGQRTHTNARTRKGPKRTVANKKKAVRK